MIEEVTPESPHYERVIELGNQNRKTLGFLPYAAIRAAAAEGRVLAFVEGGVVKGYALFGKRFRTGDISLTHLCVHRESRGKGIARAWSKKSLNEIRTEPESVCPAGRTTKQTACGSN